ncbi:hypothetical protein [Candidatus Venteria ishoeyi]|uniref:Uncharacterized protein n=1 Tax=Candidatus Venteria ishoeyi TaxID=1899563 RepID=A0A1H6F7H6_9GAMM|nr:hypothetical protein [Candidatus Venteria ishoeyi]SEH05269.1 Uncharacterised protein [Candidatus Venteria ishoeyi]
MGDTVNIIPQITEVTIEVATGSAFNDSDVLKDTDALSAVTVDNKLITENDIGNIGGGDMLKSVYDTTANGIIDNAEKVNNLTVEKAVPSNAVFTDTNYVAALLPNVNNTSDANKPISTATQTALNGKVDDAQVLTNVPADAVFTDTNYVAALLPNVDNTSDANKPVSSAQQTALNGKVDDAQVLTNVPADALFTDTNYVASLLPNVDNTSDANKPISAATQTALDNISKITRVDMGTSNAIDWSGTNGTFLRDTLTGNVTLTDSNLPQGTDTKPITLYVNPSTFSISVPSYWEFMSGTAEASVVNEFTIECINGNSGSELVRYWINPKTV